MTFLLAGKGHWSARGAVEEAIRLAGTIKKGNKDEMGPLLMC